jgi:hypothetical protein
MEHPCSLLLLEFKATVVEYFRHGMHPGNMKSFIYFQNRLCEVHVSVTC